MGGTCCRDGEMYVCGVLWEQEGKNLLGKRRCRWKDIRIRLKGGDVVWPGLMPLCTVTSDGLL
jgi:hypothetical protein